ncbi:MAG: S8 family serine peptidase [Emticicia sp.]|uniref:S8 family serine peptidase n=1 Tax=Emticicia sp. TaxID=1930953 RepID=UPI003BA56B87
MKKKHFYLILIVLLQGPVSFGQLNNMSTAFEYQKDETRPRGSVIFIKKNGDLVVKDEKIYLLNPNGKTYRDKGREAAIMEVIRKYKNLYRSQRKTIPDITYVECCKGSNLILLRGQGLDAQTNPDPDDGSAGDNSKNHPPHAGEWASNSYVFSPKLTTLNRSYSPINEEDCTNCSQIKVAILDNGVNFEKLNLPKSMFFTRKELDCNSTSDEISGLNFTSIGDRFETQDIPLQGSSDPQIFENIGHGTLVTKIIASNQKVRIKILPMKIMHHGDGVLFDALCAMMYAAQNNFDVINCSWGVKGLKNEVFEDVIHLLKSKNIVLIASTGNEKKPLGNVQSGGFNEKYVTHYPAMFAFNNHNVISVSNTELGNFGSTYTSLEVENNNEHLTNIFQLDDNDRYTSYSAALVTALFVSKLEQIRGIQIRYASSTSNAMGNLKTIFCKQSDIIVQTASTNLAPQKKLIKRTAKVE